MMSKVDTYIESSSNSSCSEVKNNKADDRLIKNIYDLNEFKETSEDNNITYINNDNCSDILQKLSQKYFPSSSNSSQQHIQTEIIVLSDSSSDEDSNKCNSNEELKNQQLEFSINKNINKLQTESHTKTGVASKNARKTKNADLKPVNSGKLMVKSYENNTEEKLKKKYEKKEKRNQAKPSKPEKLLEDITVNMDCSIFNNDQYGNTIKDYLDSCGISYQMTSSLTGLISWSRKIYTIDSSIPQATDQKEKHYLLIIIPQQFDSLMQIILDIKENTDFQHLTILVYGLNKPTSAHEEKMMEIDIYYSIFWQYVLTKEDLALFIFMATKSVAQIPYKKDQEEKFKLQNEYFNDSNKDVVKVDKNGNGLSRLWRQMLTMFPLARLETAEAIDAVYPTMSSLFQAYKECDESGETLIQNLPIRRAHGPLATVKKLGPELSRKYYKYFNSEENIFL